MVKPILNEASYSDIAEVLNSKPFKDWSSMNMIESLSHNFSFHDEKTAKENLLINLTEFWDSKRNHGKSSAKVVTKATHLVEKTTEVIDSRPVRSIINDNISEQKRYIQKQSRVSVRDDILDQGYRDAEISLASEHLNTSTVDKTEAAAASGASKAHREIEELFSRKRKKRKALHLKEFRALSKPEQLQKLTEFHGSEGTLDLTKKASIPKKLANEIRTLKETYGLNLPYLLKEDEHVLLKNISKCRDKESLYATVKDIDPFTKETALPFIKQAILKLCYLYKDGLLDNADHNEDWFRIMVYGDLFDYLFASRGGYMTKRSECHSRIVKSLKELGLVNEQEPNVKLDFIFCNTSITGINDVFICEDKPTEAESVKDITKTRKLREKSLMYWKAILPHSHALEHLSSTSCRFNKLKLLITSTKIINETTVHTTIKETSIPVSERSGGAIADYLTIIISLMRTIVRNIDIIESIIQVNHEDNLIFLSPNDFDIYDSDSDSSVSSTESDVKEDWKERERETRIKEKVDEAINSLNEQYKNDYVSTNWEDNAFTDNN
ncbi:hypothetical protein BD408DRAFT_389390 [Parasitella parasitica]|nr:hypothetical protein BD408DRAFT_389390 [Parasitella parasitica]